jgi:tetratricopeptide (TPR) repeat protein
MTDTKGGGQAEAEQALGAGDLSGAHAAALQGLASDPDDPGLLRMAGRAAFELGLDDATTHLRRVTELTPDDPQAWRDLGAALLADGNIDQATEALGEAVGKDAQDITAMVSLAHLEQAAGRIERAIELLEGATKAAPDDADALRGLVDVYRAEGRDEAAVGPAAQLVAGHPDDVLAILDLVELHMALDQHNEAIAALRRLRKADTEPGHNLYAYHALIEVEIARGGWRHALDLALEAAEIDRLPLTTELLAFVSGQVFGSRGQTSLAVDDIRRRLAARRQEHHRIHVEDSA